MKTDLIIGNQYFLISDSNSSRWNNGICTLLDYDGNRATIYKINTKTKVNVPTSQLYTVIKAIIVKTISENLKEGDIIDATLHKFIPSHTNNLCWYINGYHYDLEFAISLAEHRENKINEILYEDN